MHRFIYPLVIAAVLIAWLIAPVTADQDPAPAQLAPQDLQEIERQLSEFSRGLVVVEVERDRTGRLTGVREVARYELLDELREQAEAAAAERQAISAKLDVALAALQAGADQADQPQTDEPVGADINSATYDELLTVGGIGPVKAGAIIAERDASGGGLFTSWQDLQRRVSGIGPGTVADMQASGARIGGGVP